MFTQKFKFIFIPTSYVRILNSYPHSMSPMARFKRSAFLRGGFAVLLNNDQHIGTCGAHQLIGHCQPGILPLTRMMSLRPSCIVRTICGQVVTSCLHLGASSSHPYPNHPPTPCNAGLKLMHTCTFEKSSEKA